MLLYMSRQAAPERMGETQRDWIPVNPGHVFVEYVDGPDYVPVPRSSTSSADENTVYCPGKFSGAFDVLAFLELVDSVSIAHIVVGAPRVT